MTVPRPVVLTDKAQRLLDDLVWVPLVRIPMLDEKPTGQRMAVEDGAVTG